MNIEFRYINSANYKECIDLSLHEEQRGFVASNMFSLVQAAYEPEFYPLGIYKDDIMVGFILYDFDVELNGWSMSRLMIDKKYQKQGMGKIALQEFLEFFMNKHGHIQLYTSAKLENQHAIALYEKFGFEKKEVFEYEAYGKSYKEIRMVVQL